MAQSAVWRVCVVGEEQSGVCDRPEAADIDKAVKQFRSAMTQSVREFGSSEASLRDVHRSENGIGEASASLRKMIWQPLEKYLEETQRIYVAPDRMLSLIPFEALARAEGSRSRILCSLPYPARLSLLHTSDFASIVLALLANGDVSDRLTYFVSDGKYYRVVDLLALIRQLAIDPKLVQRLHSRFFALAHDLPFFRSLEYWRHALLSEYFFCVNPVRFHRDFPQVSFRSVQQGLRETYDMSW
jgi:hypothetical protein